MNFLLLIYLSMLFLTAIFQENPKETTQFTKRILSSTTFHNFTYTIDTTFVDQSNLTLAYYYINSIVIPALNKLSTLFQVSGNSSIPAFNSVNGCFNDQLIPLVYKSNPIATDILLFLVLDGNPYKKATSSSVCLRDASGRPTVGILYGSNHFLFPSFNNTNYLIKLNLMESIRFLAFSMTNFGYFPGGTSQTYIQTTRSTVLGITTAIKIITSNVLNWARIYYACSSIDGMYLEDEGDTTTINSYWETTLLGYELLTATAAYNAPLSMFTLMLLQDSGWYNVNTTMAEVIDFGRNAGCSFFDISICSGPASEFCQVKGLNTCSRSGVYRTVCKASKYSNGCNVNIPIGNSKCSSPIDSFKYLYDDESPGPNSKCQNLTVGLIQTSACLTTVCNLNGTLFLNFSGVQYECSASTLPITVSGNMNLTCPLYRSTCFQNGCYDGCYGNGNCLENGQCNCDYFYTGSRCQIYGGCGGGNASVCAIVSPSNKLAFETVSTQFFNLTKNSFVEKILVLMWFFCLSWKI